MVVQGQGPGPRYGHVIDLVAQRYLVTVSGNDGESNSLFGYILSCHVLSEGKHVKITRETLFLFLNDVS